MHRPKHCKYNDKDNDNSPWMIKIIIIIIIVYQEYFYPCSLLLQILSPVQWLNYIINIIIIYFRVYQKYSYFFRHLLRILFHVHFLRLCCHYIINIIIIVYLGVSRVFLFLLIFTQNLISCTHLKINYICIILLFYYFKSFSHQC